MNAPGYIKRVYENRVNFGRVYSSFWKRGSLLIEVEWITPLPTQKTVLWYEPKWVTHQTISWPNDYAHEISEEEYNIALVMAS